MIAPKSIAIAACPTAPYAATYPDWSAAGAAAHASATCERLAPVRVSARPSAPPMAMIGKPTWTHSCAAPDVNVRVAIASVRTMSMIPATWMSQIAAQRRVSARIAPIPATGSGSFQYGMTIATTNWPIEARMAAGAASRQSVVRSMPEMLGPAWASAHR